MSDLEIKNLGRKELEICYKDGVYKRSADEIDRLCNNQGANPAYQPIEMIVAFKLFDVEAKLAVAVSVLSQLEDRYLDWDMMSTKGCRELIQRIRRDASDAIEQIKQGPLSENDKKHLEREIEG